MYTFKNIIFKTFDKKYDIFFKVLLNVNFKSYLKYKMY